jgi:hypothetical protein
VTAWLAANYADGVTAARHYPGVTALVEHHVAEAARGWGSLTQRYGDWCAVPRGFGDGCVHVTNASGYLYFILSLDAAAALAGVVGKPADAARYAGLAGDYRAAFQAHEFNAASCTYGGGSPFEAAAALALGVAQAANATACVVAAMRAYYTGGGSPFPGHMNGGILSARHVFPALSDGGAHDLAVTMALQTSFPSYGWWLTNGATTLAERWQNTLAAPLADSSLDHVMFAGVSPWMASRVAGLQRASSVLGALGTTTWRQLVVAPGPDARVGYASASLLAIDGAVGAGWALPAAASSPDGAVCGTAADGSQLTLACVGADGNPAPGGAFTGVLFASYGQPAGGCFGPLRASAACASNVSAAVVGAACVGKAACTIDVSAATFGGVDPCPGHPKRLAVQLAGGGGCAVPTLTVTANVPVNGAATVVLPLNASVGGGAPAAALVYEGGRLVWAGGRSGGGYVPGTPGVGGAAAGATADGGPAVVVTVGSGAYAFVVAQVP